MRTHALAVLLLSGVAAAAPQLEVPKIAYEKYVLPNGLQVIFHVDKKLPLVHVNLWYHVGSKNEKPGRTGFAHLFEHLMLQGSKNASQDFFSLMQRAGARPGRDSNGTTEPDRTNYFSTAPSGSLEYLLWVHSDLLATLLDAMTQAKLDNQREVVRNERRQGLDNVPYGRWYKLLTENLFPAGHPYSWPVIGSHEDLAAASLEDVKSFFRTYYTPNNLSLVVSGDFQPAEAKKLIDKFFGSIPPGPALDRPGRNIPKLDREKIVEVNDWVSQERVFIGWLAPEIGADGEAELTLLASILTDGLSSRLQKRLVYDKKLCSEVSSFNNPGEIAGAFVVDATARPGASLPDIERVIAAEVARIVKEGPTAAELERARTKQLTALASTLQSIGAFGGKADVLNYYNVYFGDPGKMEADVGRVLKATPLSVRQAATAWLGTPNRVIVRFHPEASVRGTTAEPDRSVAPNLGADTPFEVPKVETGTLPNGLEFYVVERHELPIVTAALMTRAGSINDPSGKEGLARLVADTMTRGTKTRDAIALANALGDLGTQLQVNVGKESAALAVQVQSPNLAAAVALLGDVARNPRFPEAEIDRERKIKLDEIEQIEHDVPSIARRVRDLLAYGGAHPYGRPTAGFRKSVASISPADVATFHSSYWKPQGAALIFVGDVTLADARALATKEFGAWSGAPPPPPAIPAPTPMAKGKVILVDRPDAAQTYVIHIYGAPTKKGDDYYGWKLASEVLGGGTAGRLFMNLRQDKGYSYGVFTATPVYSSAMGWIGQGAVQTDKTTESAVEFVKELKGIAGDRAITAAELDNARLGLIRNYAAGFGTNNDIAFRIADLWTMRWPMTELEREPAELARVPLVDVAAAAKRYAVPADATLLLVGDRAKIEAGVRSLEFGEIVILDVEGRPIGQH